MIKLVAIDMDGTLLSSSHEISERNKEAIKGALEKGVKIVLCSGRTINNLLEFTRGLGLIGEEEYVVGHNGAAAMRIIDEEYVYENSLTGKEAKEIAKVCDSVDANYTIYTFHEAMTPRDNAHGRYEAELNSMKLKVCHPRVLDDEEKITKVLILDDEEVLDSYIGEIRKHFDDQYNLVRSMPVYLEIMRKEVNKMSGIMAVAKLHGIEESEIMAIGDAPNDLEMIEGAGLGVAMGNAHEIIKEASDFITRTNDEDGVAYVLNRYLHLGMDEKHGE